MRIESKLCHISENKAVVQVFGWINDKMLGSALAEGITVEVAEDKAISRLSKRINEGKNDEPRINSTQVGIRVNNRKLLQHVLESAGINEEWGSSSSSIPVNAPFNILFISGSSTYFS